ncbi:DUF6090 family protein [Psychroserpens luteus]|uniref:DUF6090 family protein n=1 Tax=Psychroserpens luteus TaxID=1434066 RepID=A0ABW5ZPB6_9FLAO|nr:DUF6090 family protein [Psychroserpens luteus]
MIKLFRKIRQKTLTENKFGKYLTYAIGEIILVVIGILIALSINNWNENKINENQLNNIYNEVELNLKSDLSNIDAVIKQYEQLEIRLEKMITGEYSSIPLDSIDATNYSDFIPGKRDINNFINFEVQDKGLGLIKTYNNFNTSGNRDFTNEIIQFYKIVEPLILVLDKLKEESFDNIKYFEKFSWYSDYMNIKYNPEAIDFFVKNEIFKNKVITYRLVAIQNYLPLLRYYKESATTILEKIEKAE